MQEGRGPVRRFFFVYNSANECKLQNEVGIEPTSLLVRLARYDREDIPPMQLGSELLNLFCPISRLFILDRVQIDVGMGPWILLVLRLSQFKCCSFPIQDGMGPCR